MLVGANVLKDCVVVGANVLKDCVLVGANVLKDCVLVGASVAVRLSVTIPYGSVLTKPRRKWPDEFSKTFFL